ncbi:MAG: carbon-nitrogen hydrolase family protein [Polyangiaceae bacterium]
MTAKTVRVAALQFAASDDVARNLATCLRMIDRAAEEKADLAVLPEFANHASWYDDHAHCHRVAVDLDGQFLTTIGERARRYRMHIVVNCTVRRGADVVTATSVLFDDQGQRLAASDKQVLIGHENDFLKRSDSTCPIIETRLGRIGLYACMDGVIFETPRGIALSGADILCNSLNSFALDEADLHVPVRAAENHVFVVAANKSGPLIPEAVLEPVSAATAIPVKFLNGAGESQIVAPDGRVLAKAPREGETVIVADIDPRQARDKRRPDGSDRFAVRRPELYRAIGEDPTTQDRERPAAARLEVAIVTPKALGPSAVEEVAAKIAELTADGVELVVLPELFCFAGGTVSDPIDGLGRSQLAIDALAASCKRGARVVTSLVTHDAGQHRLSGVVIGPQGLEAAQPMLHRCGRHPWAAPGDVLRAIELPWGRLAVLPGADSIQPESTRLAAIAGAEVVAVPFAPQESWELATGLVERSAENRVCLLAATEPGPLGSSMITTLEEDFTVMTPWKNRAFDGLLSFPIVKRAGVLNVLRATVHPERAHNRVVSRRTDLVAGRPWQLAGAITKRAEHG